MGMHKNVDGTVRAFMRAKEKYELPHKLLIVGMKHYGYDKLLRLVHQENRGEKIAYLGYVDEETLSSLYSHTDLLLLLSLEEGFGLPVLEGMAAGVPVLAANTSSLPEIVGDAGILVDPLDTEGIADAMYECLLDQDMRSNLVIKGLERTKLFPWRRTAELTLAAYRDAFRMRRQSREVLVSDHHMVRGNGVKR
jgi:glycosyltransferase involved in cell wall biosynthesis